jgi:hypothetical protein
MKCAKHRFYGTLLLLLKTKQGYVEQIKDNGVLPLFIPLWELSSKKFHGGFHMPIIERIVLKTFLKKNELSINYK